jgi:MFS family permease
MRRPLRWYDYLTINIYWLGLTTLSQTNGLILPLLVQRFVGEETKATAYGQLRLWTLMVALLAQALLGMLSDRSTLRWGRRRPFVFIGTIANLACITAIGLSSSFQGMAGYWFLFAVVILQQIASNTAHGAEQGFIPDLVPSNQRGRFSAVKAVLEIPVPVILVAFTVAPIVGGGSIWGGLLVAMTVLTLTMLLTMLVPERPLEIAPPPLDWTPFLRLVLMTGLFTAVILGMGEGVQLIVRLIAPLASATAKVFILGAVGLIAMAAAVALGVWLSVQISVGRAARENPSFTWWVVSRLAFLVGTVNLSTFAVYFLQGRLGYREEDAAGPAGQLMMVVGIFILVSALPSGWLSDRFGAKRIVAISGVMATLGTVVLLLSTNLTIIYAGGCFIGIAAGLFYTANWALGTSLVPREEAGRYLGISNLAGAGAGAVGAYIGGPIADFFTAQVPEVAGLGYVLLYAIYGLLFFLSVLALRGVNPRAFAEDASEP